MENKSLQGEITLSITVDTKDFEQNNITKCTILLLVVQPLWECCFLNHQLHSIERRKTNKKQTKTKEQGETITNNNNNA